MTQPGSPVTTVPGFELQPNTDPGGVVVQLYQLQTTEPERIESVYLTLAYSTIKPTFQTFAVRLLDAANNILYEQPTPVFNAADNADLTVVLGWSRLGNDSAQQTFAYLDDPDAGYTRAWANMRLPDLVLAPSSTVQLVSWGFFETISGTIPVSDCSITTTRNAGAVSSTTAVDVTPYLLPAFNG